jgi:CubicO group peptidase (beta-lactamase class C family)
MRTRRLSLALAAALAASTATATPPTPAEFASYAHTLLSKDYRDDAPGVAVLVMRGDEVLYRGARGEADVVADVPLKPGDPFRIGSVTKQFAAAGLLKLVDAGKVSLDDPLSKYLPDYPGAANITIDQLLNHTSGIRSYTGIPGVMDGPIQRDLTTAQLVDFFKNEKPDFAPGEAWGYNNSGYVLVGAVIEVVSGQPWHQYLEQVLFKPLGMKDTGYGADPDVIAGQVKGYVMEGEVAVPPLLISMTQPHAAGALVSTVDDLARWNRALHEGQVLKPATYARMTTPAGKAQDGDYGYGIGTFTVRGAPALGHGGGIPGFNAYLTYLQGPDITVAVLQNNETPAPAQESGSLARRLAAAALGDPYPLLAPVAVDAAVLKQYEGVYRVNETVTRTVRVVDGKMTVRRTDRPREELIPIAENAFLYSDGFNRLQFDKDAAGKVTGMRLFPEGEGEGDLAPLTDEPLPVAITLPREARQRLAGVYRMGDQELTITLEGEGLNGHIKGQSQGVPFVAMSPTLFAGDIVGAELRFAPDAGPAQTATLRQWGEEMVFERVPSTE